MQTVPRNTGTHVYIPQIVFLTLCDITHLLEIDKPWSNGILQSRGRICLCYLEMNGRTCIWNFLIRADYIVTVLLLTEHGGASLNCFKIFSCDTNIWIMWYINQYIIFVNSSLLAIIATIALLLVP